MLSSMISDGYNRVLGFTIESVKNHIVALLLLLLLLLSSSSTSLAQTCEATGSGRCFYVATNGNDNNNGSFAAPFRTVQRGLNALTVAGDAVYLRAGTYHERVSTNSNGTAQNPKTISGYPGETAIIDGDHSSWTFEMSGNHYLVLKNLTIIEGARPNADIDGLHATILLADSSHLTLSNLDVSGTNGYCNGVSAQIFIGGSTFITVENSRIHDSNFQPRNGAHNCGGIGLMGEGGAGLGDITIRNNTIYNMTQGSAVWEKHPGYGNTEAYGNIIYNTAVAFWLRQSNVNVHHNRIYNKYPAPGPYAAVHIQKESNPANSNISLTYNTFAVCPEAAISYRYGLNVTLKNNIYYECTNKDSASGPMKTYTICDEDSNYGSCYEAGAGINQIDSDNNCIYYTPNTHSFVRYNGSGYSLAQVRTNYGFDLNSVFANPQFISTNPASPDFLRPANAQCANMGSFAGQGSDTSPPAAPANLVVN